MGPFQRKLYVWGVGATLDTSDYLEESNQPQSKLISSILLPFIELNEQNPRNTQKLTIPMTPIEELKCNGLTQDGFENRNTCPRGANVPVVD